MLRRRDSQVIPPELLLDAYSQGFFPMADSRTGRVQWYTADPRAVLPFRPLHVPRRVQRWLRSVPYRYTRDQQFEAVIRACADRADSWINEAIIRSYCGLHRAGHAHSVEVWREGELVGGLYGVSLGGAFFGESMFNRESGASKAALVHLAEHLDARGFQLLEIQMITSLTEQFGAELVTRKEYLPLLGAAAAVDAQW